MSFEGVTDTESRGLGKWLKLFSAGTLFDAKWETIVSKRNLLRALGLRAASPTFAVGH
jgi:hypothetical protein